MKFVAVSRSAAHIDLKPLRADQNGAADHDSDDPHIR